MGHRWLALAMGLLVAACFEESDPVAEGPASTAADTAPATDGSGSEPTSDGDDSSTGAGDDPGTDGSGMVDSSGGSLPDPYANCTVDEDCREGETCLAPARTCGAVCQVDMDCPPPPNGSAIPSCLTPVVERCRLLCQTAEDCPTGMQCFMAGEQSVCSWINPG